MQREEVERLIGDLMAAEDDPEIVYWDESKKHLPADAAKALRALLDRAEKAESERDAALAEREDGAAQ